MKFLPTTLGQLAATDPHAAAALLIERRRARHGDARMDLGGTGYTGKLLERTVQEREQCLTLIEGVTRAAFEAERDLSDQDHDTIKRAQERVAFLDQQIERVSIDAALSDRAQNALRSNAVSTLQQPLVYRSAGEALYDLLHLDQRESRTRLEAEMNRAAQHIGTTAAGTTPVAGGLGALVVRPVIGPVIDPTPQGRPFLTALGIMPMDSPLGFSRPRIVDNVRRPGHADYQDAPAVQALEKAELVSRAFDIKLDNIDTDTVGEYLNVSQKVLSLPIGALNIVLSQFAKRRAAKTEALAVAEILTTTSEVPLEALPTVDETDAGNIWDAIWAAAALVYSKTGELPQWLAMGPDAWARVGSLRDKADRPLFPTIGAANAMGAMSTDAFTTVGPAGLRTIVTPEITGPEMIVGNSAALEVYEYAYPMLEAVEPAVLGRQIAVASEIAFYRPATDETAASDAGTGNAAGNGAVVIRPAA